MIKTGLASVAAASLFGLAAAAGTVLAGAAPANASTAAPAGNGSRIAPSPQVAQRGPAGPKTGSKAGQPLSGDPYPESAPFPSLPGHRWKYSGPVLGAGRYTAAKSLGV